MTAAVTHMAKTFAAKQVIAYRPSIQQPSHVSHSVSPVHDKKHVQFQAQIATRAPARCTLPLPIAFAAAHWEGDVLKSCKHVAEQAAWVKVQDHKIRDVADWMAYEEFGEADGSMLFDFGSDADVIMDVILAINTLNFAFTDFASGVKFEVNYLGKVWCDSEAMVACLHRAVQAGVPFFNGSYLSAVSRAQLAAVFAGTIEMPMLDERVAILNDVGRVLCDKHAGRFCNFVRACSAKLYDGGNGILERLVEDFPRFSDTITFGGHRVHVFKLAQLAIWSLHLTLSPRGLWRLEDPHMLTAFADYIVPVGLRVMGILQYAPSLEADINSLTQIPRDSAAEVELRACSVYAIARLTDELNLRRAGMKPLLMPQVDFRFWKSYHATHWPHHLTRTIMY